MVRDNYNNGWFAGYVETKNYVHFFATNVVPKDLFNHELFHIRRKDVTYDAQKEFSVLK